MGGFLGWGTFYVCSRGVLIALSALVYVWLALSATRRERLEPARAIDLAAAYVAALGAAGAIVLDLYGPGRGLLDLVDDLTRDLSLTDYLSGWSFRLPIIDHCSPRHYWIGGSDGLGIHACGAAALVALLAGLAGDADNDRSSLLLFLGALIGALMLAATLLTGGMTIVRINRAANDQPNPGDPATVDREGAEA